MSALLAQVSSVSDVNSVFIVFSFLILVVVVLPIAITWIKTRDRKHEQRMRLIRELSAEGKLSREQLETLLHMRSPLTNIALVLAWFALFGGMGMIAFFLIGGVYADDDLLAGGIILLLGALAVLSAPIMLRELRRQQPSQR